MVLGRARSESNVRYGALLNLFDQNVSEDSLGVEASGRIIKPRGSECQEFITVDSGFTTRSESFLAQIRKSFSNLVGHGAFGIDQALWSIAHKF